MAARNQRILYQAKNNSTGLTDVKGQVYFNQVAKAVGGSALVFTELDATNAPGIYYLDIAASTLITWGLTVGGPNDLEISIDSVLKPAATIYKASLTVNNDDDTFGRVGAPAGASVSADIAAVKADTAAIKVDLESGANNLSLIYTAINSIKNNAGFSIPVPEQLTVPATGSNSYRIPVTLYNESNALIDADSNTITVGLVNQAGTSRDSYLASTTMTRDSIGQYRVDLSIAAGSVEEELIFTFSYAIGGAATARKATTLVIRDEAAEGLALQATLLATQTTVNANNSVLTSGTFGNAAIKTAVDAVQADVTNNILGSGFSQANDTLHQASLYMRANLFIGGRAV